MDKTVTKKQTHTRSETTKILVFTAICIAMSIVLSKYLSFHIGTALRIGLGGLPVIFAGIFLGPVFGAIVGAVADLLGCIFAGFAINPILTAGLAFTGAMSGILYRFVFKKQKLIWRLFLSVYPAAAVGSLLISTFGLWYWFAKDTSFFVYLVSSGRIISFLVNYFLIIQILGLIIPPITKAFPPFIMRVKKEKK